MQLLLHIHSDVDTYHSYRYCEARCASHSDICFNLNLLFAAIPGVIHACAHAR
jgi:hypothetical protein